MYYVSTNNTTLLSLWGLPINVLHNGHIPHVGLSHRGQQPPTSQGELHEIASRVLNLYIDSDWKIKILN
jgi:hypothetical protein